MKIIKGLILSAFLLAVLSVTANAGSAYVTGYIIRNSVSFCNGGTCTYYTPTYQNLSRCTVHIFDNNTAQDFTATPNQTLYYTVEVTNPSITHVYDMTVSCLGFAAAHMSIIPSNYHITLFPDYELEDTTYAWWNSNPSMAEDLTCDENNECSDIE